MQTDPVDMIDMQQYPIDQPGTARVQLIDEVNNFLSADSCAILKDFVRAEYIPALIAECDRVAPYAHRNFNKTNVYFTTDRADLPHGRVLPIHFEKEGQRADTLID